MGDEKRFEFDDEIDQEDELEQIIKGESENTKLVKASGKIISVKRRSDICPGMMHLYRVMRCDSYICSCNKNTDEHLEDGSHLVLGINTLEGTVSVSLPAEVNTDFELIPYSLALLGQDVNYFSNIKESDDDEEYISYWKIEINSGPLKGEKYESLRTGEIMDDNKQS